MASANNFYNELFCYFKDGQYVTFPLFQDLSTVQILTVRKLNLPNENNVLVPSYLVTAKDPQNIRTHTYYISATDYYPTLATLCTALNALNSGNAFTCYTGLKSIDAVPVIQDLDGSIIVNDNWCDTRQYIVNEDKTVINLNTGQSIYYIQIKVDGDQTTAANYYYDVYL